MKIISNTIILMIAFAVSTTVYANDMCHHVVLAECDTKNGSDKVEFIGLLNIEGVRFSDRELSCQDPAHASLEFDAYLNTTNEVHNWCYIKSATMSTSFNGTQDYKRAKKIYREMLANCMKYDSIKKCFSYKDINL